MGHYNQSKLLVSCYCCDFSTYIIRRLILIHTIRCLTVLISQIHGGKKHCEQWYCERKQRQGDHRRSQLLI